MNSSHRRMGLVTFIETDPNHLYADEVTGYLDRGDGYAESRHLYQYILSAWPEYPEAVRAHQGVAYSSAWLKDYETAQAQADVLFTDYGDHPDIVGILMGLADRYFWSGTAHIEAATLYRRILFTWPEHPEILHAYHGLASVAEIVARAGDTETGMKLADEVFSYPLAPDQLLFAYSARAKVYVHQGKDAEAAATVNDAIKRFRDDPNGLTGQLIGVAEEYYHRAQKQARSHDHALAADSYAKAIATLQTHGPIVSEAPLRDQSSAFYMSGLSYWQRGEWFPAAMSYLDSIEADPNHIFAGSMHWLVSDCYEKLKRDGQVTDEEADPMIEWGYQTLFDHYPDSRDVKYAAIQLGKLHLARGEPVSAGVYFNWYLDNAHAGDGQFADIRRILEEMEGCGR